MPVTHRPRNPLVKSHHLTAEDALKRKLEKLEERAGQPDLLEELERDWPQYERAQAEYRRKLQEWELAHLNRWSYNNQPISAHLAAVIMASWRSGNLPVTADDPDRCVEEPKLVREPKPAPCGPVKVISPDQPTVVTLEVQS